MIFGLCEWEVGAFELGRTFCISYGRFGVENF